MTTFKSSRTITVYFETRGALFRAACRADHLEEQVLLRRYPPLGESETP
jgi:hypothetical protein